MKERWTERQEIKSKGEIGLPPGLFGDIYCNAIPRIQLATQAARLKCRPISQIGLCFNGHADWGV